MWIALAIIEAIAASLAFMWLAKRYVVQNKRLRAAQWKADTLQAIEDRRAARRAGLRKRADNGQFVA